MSDKTAQADSIVETVSAGEARDISMYHGSPEEVRLAVIERLEKHGLKSLTGMINKAKKRAFAEAAKRFLDIAAGSIKTPVYLLDETLIEENMRVMRYVRDRSGCKVFHALKSYASFATFPIMSKYLDGTCASGVNEARLGREEFGKEVHTFGAAYGEGDIGKILEYSDSIVFNSFYQLRKYGKIAKASGVETGIRVNPGYSEVAAEMYNPCAPNSRLGVTHGLFTEEFPKYKHMVDGLHFHAMCEQNSDVLGRILESFERLYGPYLEGLKWVNFGGGHHITRDDYDIERLVGLVKGFKKKYGPQVYLEPGEASVYNAGVLISSVLDIVQNGMDIAILDTSAETHMPDVLLMPYRPHVMRSAGPGVKKHTYRLAGPSCLAGDVIGDYSFNQPLKRGDKLVFTDMVLYSIVKNTTFNGVNLPDIAVVKNDGHWEVVKTFGYDDYRHRQS